LDITDPVVNTFSANINFDSISSIEVLTGGMEAQYNSLGGIINLITAGGSDEWHVDSSLYVGNTRFSTGGQYGSQLYQGQVPLSVSGDPSYISNTDTADANYRLPIAQDYQEQGGAFAIVQWDWFINNNTNFNLQTGFLYNHIYSGPQGYFSSLDHVPGENKFS